MILCHPKSRNKTNKTQKEKIYFVAIFVLP